MKTMTKRDININAVCAHCGELLDTNELPREAIDESDGSLDLEGLLLIVGTEHFCFKDLDEEEA
jgi:hypothetical protein